MRYVAIFLFGILGIFGCKQNPVDAVYYGTWINTYTEDYSYETQDTTFILEEEWIDKKWSQPPIILLEKGSRYTQLVRDRNGRQVERIQGKWSTRNNNDLTIQTDDFLFSGSIVLLNEVLTIKGHQYPLDRYKRSVQAEGIKRQLVYRQATQEERDVRKSKNLY